MTAQPERRDAGGRLVAPARPAVKSEYAFRTIGEASEELGIAAHVLRFWETKFPEIAPVKRGGGRRYYRPEDVAFLRGVRRLLHVEGYSIKGAQKLIMDQGVAAVIARGRLDDSRKGPVALAPPPVVVEPPPLWSPPPADAPPTIDAGLFEDDFDLEPSPEAAPQPAPPPAPSAAQFRPPRPPAPLAPKSAEAERRARLEAALAALLEARALLAGQDE